jgi:hypothetical protein
MNNTANINRHNNGNGATAHLNRFHGCISPKEATNLLNNILSADEIRELAAVERVIEKGWETFVDVGRALQRIRDGKLYRASHKTFESYCKTRWQYGKSQAYRLIGAAQVVQILSPIGDIPAPTHEAQVRPLIGMEPEKAKAAWRQAVANAGEEAVTARLIKSIVSGQQPIPDTVTSMRKQLMNGRSSQQAKSKLLQNIQQTLKAGAEKQVLMNLLKQAAAFLEGEVTNPH